MLGSCDKWSDGSFYGPSAVLHPRGGATVCVGGRRTSFLENSTRKQRQERGSGSRKLHPLSTRNTVAMVAWRGGEESTGGAGVFFFRSHRWKQEEHAACQTGRSSEIIKEKNPTGDHLLGVVWLHVAVVLADTLRLPLLPRLLSVKRIRVVFKDDHLDLKEKRQTTTFVSFCKEKLK